MRNIKVTGKGQLKVRPDLTRITLRLQDCCKEYGKAVLKSAEDTEALKDLLEKFGFERSELKTVSFDIHTKYQDYRENGSSKRVFVGYEYCHELKVEFDPDNERMGKVLYALAHCPMTPEIQVSYTVKDREAAKNALLADAVRNAKVRAAVLAQSAGVKLGRIESIDYSWGEINFDYAPMGSMMLSSCIGSRAEANECYDMDINPDDIEVSDTVTIIWEIE